MQFTYRSILAVILLITATQAAEQPNFVFFLADDWGREASCYADPQSPSSSQVVQTPNIDRVAREGVRFNNAFFDCPQCSPSRSAIVTGRYFWRNGSKSIMQGADWTGRVDPFTNLPRFPHLLAENGYATGKAVKTMDFDTTLKINASGFERYGLYLSEAKTETDREKRRQVIIDQTRSVIRQVLDKCPPGKPFFFVYGPVNTHRPFAPGSGKALWGIDSDSLKGKLPVHLPDVPEVRTDYADYLGEVQALDLMVGVFMEELEKSGRADNTMLVLTGDNGVPGFPRGKTELYDLGCRAPLLVRWPAAIRAGRTVDDFVTLKDLTSTFLEAGGVKPPASMDSRSLMPLLRSEKSGVIDPTRDAAIFGRERHVPNVREGNLPYPSRAIRSKDFLYIRNFKPERYPLGDPKFKGNDSGPDAELSPGSYGDMDASLTKTWLFEHHRDDTGKTFYESAFGKRPAEELYDLRKDPQQMHNLATSAEYQGELKHYSTRLMKVLQDTADPRLEDAYDRLPYVVPGKMKKESLKEE
jgi:N-sulfoglucosamine sulfohydrolase